MGVDGDVVFRRAFGLANRLHAVANDVDTMFGIARVTKGLTVLTVGVLVERGASAMTSARSLFCDDLRSSAAR